MHPSLIDEHISFKNRSTSQNTHIPPHISL